MRSEAARAVRARAQGLAPAPHPQEPFPGDDGGNWGPRVFCKPQNKCTGTILPQSGLWEAGP